MPKNVSDRLIDSAAELFLERDFYSVSIRELAERADTSSGMIKYYFNNKQGLFEAMIKREYGKILEILKDLIVQEGFLNFTDIINQVMAVYDANPNIPKFIIRTYLLRKGPGSQFLEDSFEFERKLIQNWTERVISEGKVNKHVDAEVARIAFMSLTLMPGMMMDMLKTSYGNEGYQDFRQSYAEFAGEIFLYGMKPRSAKK